MKMVTRPELRRTGRKILIELRTDAFDSRGSVAWHTAYNMLIQKINIYSRWFAQESVNQVMEIWHAL